MVATLRDGKPNPGHYGFAWFVDTQMGHRVVEHEGQWQGFESQISRYLDDKFTVVVLVNSGTRDLHVTANEVAGIYLAKQMGH